MRERGNSLDDQGPFGVRALINDDSGKTNYVFLG